MNSIRRMSILLRRARRTYPPATNSERQLTSRRALLKTATAGIAGIVVGDELLQARPASALSSTTTSAPTSTSTAPSSAPTTTVVTSTTSPLLSGPAGGCLAGVYPDPSLAPSSLGNASWNAADPLSWSNVTGYPLDGPGTTPSLRSLGPGGQQAAPGAGLFIRRRVPGWHFPIGVSGNGTMVIGTTGGAQYYMPICIERPMTIDQLSVSVSATASPANHCYLALFNDDGTGNPSTLIAQVGPVSITSKGPQAFALPTPQSLPPGYYMLGFGIQQSSGSITLNALQLLLPSVVISGTGPPWGANAVVYSLQPMSAAQGFPPSVVPTNDGGGVVPFVAYHISAMT